MAEKQESRETVFHIMDDAVRLFDEAGGNFQGYIAKTRELADRLREGQFHLAILGQFKRGKSTLVNALLGSDLLPTSAVPVTALPTVISSGKERRAVIRFQNGRAEEQSFADDQTLTAFIGRYATEQENPQNRYGVARVEVKHPSALLAGGVTLIDTPGIGSTLKHNTEATVNYLAQCDAALFIVSADPPITATEVEFLRMVAGHVKKLFFILNKVDYLSVTDQAAMIAFIRQVLRDEAGFEEAVTIYAVSARNALAAKQV